MSRTQDDKYLAPLKKRYAQADKKERGKILDEYVQLRCVAQPKAEAAKDGE